MSDTVRRENLRNGGHYSIFFFAFFESVSSFDRLVVREFVAGHWLVIVGFLEGDWGLGIGD